MATSVSARRVALAQALRGRKSGMGHLSPRLVSGLGAKKPDLVAAVNTPARVDVSGPFTER